MGRDDSMAARSIFELKPIECPEKRGKLSVLMGWEKEEGDKKGKRLVYIECKNPHFCWYGSDDCNWGCWDELEKEEG